MTPHRTIVGLMLLAGAARPVAVHAGGCAVSLCDPRTNCFDRPYTACFEQTCPETAWRVCVEDTGKKGLYVGPVSLKRTPTDNWLSVIYQAGLTEMLVPYHPGAPRLFDMRFCSRCMDPVSPDDAGDNGFLATLSGDTVPRLVVEERDRGVAWLCKSPNRSTTRRGEEMVIWGVYDTGNYDYMIRYGFRDDGVISFRVGATGYNNPSPDASSASDTLSDVAHMHNSLWRIDIDLGGAVPNTASVLTHSEPVASLAATDTAPLFNGGHEGFMDWDPLAFNTLLIENPSILNSHNHPIGYELVPMRTGTARHYGPGETFSQHDFYVSVWHYAESGYVAPYDWHTNGISPDSYLLPNISNNESVVKNDLVVWYSASAHHDPHDEDHSMSDTTAEMKGLTLTHWMGFDLVPHNLFDYNPLGGPHRDLCDGAP